MSKVTVLKRLLRWLIWLSAALGLLLIGWRVWLNFVYSSQIYRAVADVPPQGVAIVFGAGIRNDRPSAALADRVEGAAALYHAGKVRKLLMSGDNRFVNYNEPEVMKVYAETLGVPAKDIVLDYAGRRTYDTCYRARAIFGVRTAVLVTQEFHQARAVYLCKHFGIEPVGLAVDKRNYLGLFRLWWAVRETLALAMAWWDVNIAQPVPVLGETIPIEG